MCGIFAAMTRHGLSSDRCDAALKLLEHRGPDGTGIWTSRDGQWTLGHTRLSIIGLRNGSQPMTSPDGAVHVVVNGEFYGYRELRERLRASGYRFSTDSDSEIAVHLYRERGMQAATLLRGEFAMVIADERQREMIAIRDRFGVKPLYYAVVNGDVFFASEIKALLALGVPAAWDLEGATGGMGRSHEKTEFAGISTVPPGCYAIARDGDVRIYPYWDWEIPTAEQMRSDTRSDAEIVDEFRGALRDAVRQRLVADVEVASYLSGGIDSCAVLGLAQQEMDRPIRAFTLTSRTRSMTKPASLRLRPSMSARRITRFQSRVGRSPTHSRMRSGIPRRRCSTATASPSISSAVPSEPRASRWCSPAKAPTKCWEAIRTSASTR